MKRTKGVLLIFPRYPCLLFAWFNNRVMNCIWLSEKGFSSIWEIIIIITCTTMPFVCCKHLQDIHLNKLFVSRFLLCDSDKRYRRNNSAIVIKNKFNFAYQKDCAVCSCSSLLHITNNKIQFRQKMKSNPL